MKGFKELGIPESILVPIRKENFEEPTEIQAKAIPLVVAGKDVIAGSATGSGKTLAFGIGMIQHTVPGKGIQSLVLTPTRELAEQVGREIRKYSDHKKLRIAIIYGGVAIDPQVHDLRKADMVIGTPGRILDHVGRRTINLSGVKVLVLDEADRMLDMGFIEDVERIMKECNKDRQTLLFSATIMHEVVRIAKRYMKDPVSVSAEAYVDPKKLRQVYYDIPDGLKFSLLVDLMKNEKAGLVMVFCNSRITVDMVATNLRKEGLDAQAIHGGFSQAKRTKTMENFNSQKATILVCTDVAARGLHIEGVSHVYNYDIPKEAKQYVHRIGRTARAGKEGIAVNILASRDYDNFTRVLKEYDLKIDKAETPYVRKIQIQVMHRPSRGNMSRGNYGRGNNNGRRSNWRRR